MRERGSGRSKPRACASCQHPLHPPPPLDRGDAPVRSSFPGALPLPRSPGRASTPSSTPPCRPSPLHACPAPPSSLLAWPLVPAAGRSAAGTRPLRRDADRVWVGRLRSSPPPHSSSLVRRWPPTCLAFPPSPPPCHRCCPSCPSDMCLPSPLLAMRHTPSPPVRCRRSPPRAVASLLPVPVRRATTAALSTNCPSTCGRHPRPHQGPTCRSCGRARPTIQSPPAGQGLGREAREEGGAPRPVVPPRLA